MKPKNVAIVNYGAGFIIVEMYRNMNHVADMQLRGTYPKSCS